MKPILGPLLLGSALLAAADVYGPRPEPLEYRSVNDFEMWFVQGVDTLGEPTRIESREILTFRSADGALLVDVEMIGEGEDSRETYGIDASGRVLSVDGVAVEELATPRVELLPRIPLDWDELLPGATWTDQVERDGVEPFGPTSYLATREYQVVGEVQALGATALLLVSRGSISIRHGGWQDPNQTVSWWQEASGPVVDSVWFDTGTRALLASATHMDLTGAAGFEGGGQSMTLPSGLRSSVVRLPVGSTP